MRSNITFLLMVIMISFAAGFNSGRCAETPKGEAVVVGKSQEDIAAEKRLRKRIGKPRRPPVVVEDKTNTEKHGKADEEWAQEKRGGCEK